MFNILYKAYPLEIFNQVNYKIDDYEFVGYKIKATIKYPQQGSAIKCMKRSGSL